MWEDFLTAMSPTRLQDEYNHAIASCDVFISLFHTKVGEYIHEEFLVALETFRNSDKPLIYTYFKSAPIDPNSITEEFMTVVKFKKQLSKAEGHFYQPYADKTDLKLQFGEQLIKILPKLTGRSA